MNFESMYLDAHCEHRLAISFREKVLQDVGGNKDNIAYYNADKRVKQLARKLSRIKSTWELSRRHGRF